MLNNVGQLRHQHQGLQIIMPASGHIDRQGDQGHEVGCQTMDGKPPQPDARNQRFLLERHGLQWEKIQ